MWKTRGRSSVRICLVAAKTEDRPLSSEIIGKNYQNSQTSRLLFADNAVYCMGSESDGHDPGCRMRIPLGCG